MHSIHTHQELLFTLARNGDPSAFYTLVAQFSNAAYISERNSGKNHKEALMILIPFIKKAYQNFIYSVHKDTFDVWYREYKRKYFHSVLNRQTHSTAQDDVELTDIPMSDINHFGAIIEIVLQRQYGKLRRNKKDWFMLRARRQFNQLHWLMKTAFIFALIGVVATAFLFFLTTTKKELTLTYSANGSSHTIALPFNRTAELKENSNVLNKNAPVVADSITAIPKKIHDTLRIHDTVKVFPQRSRVVPAKTAPISNDNNASSPAAGTSADNNSSTSYQVPNKSIYDSIR